MKKNFFIAAAALLLITSPVLAARGNGNGKSDEQHGNSANRGQNENRGNSPIAPTIDPSVTPSITPSVTPGGDEESDENEHGKKRENEETCDPEANWKNHGAFVSCVAHLHLGGKVTSEAARSEIGKQHKDEEATPTPTISETTPTPTTPPISGSAQIGGGVSPLSSLQTLFSRFIDFLKSLI